MKDYLSRLNYSGEPKPDVQTFKLLHKSHLYNIPFENLDIHNNSEIFLDTESLSNKIIHNNRGGYCYELNGMFYFLLKEIGFNTVMLSARVSNAEGEWGEEFDHLTLLVKLGEQLYLTDVGFGDSFIEPLKFELDTVQKDKSCFFKITKFDDDYFKLSKSIDGSEFSDEYIFSLKERKWDEFQQMNKYHQTSPNSHFTQKKICSIATETGRISLSNDKLTITENGEKKIIEIKNEEEFNEKLLEYFNIMY